MKKIIVLSLKKREFVVQIHIKEGGGTAALGGEVFAWEWTPLLREVQDRLDRGGLVVRSSKNALLELRAEAAQLAYSLGLKGKWEVG